MSTAVAQELTLADVLRQLGGISPSRIRFRPAPRTVTEDDGQTDRSYREANADWRRCPPGLPTPVAKTVRSLGRSGMTAHAGNPRAKARHEIATGISQAV